MDKHTIVSIYQVDSAGVTGAQVGEGSLVDPRLVLVHPPLSEAIASGDGPTRLRVALVEIRSDTDEGPLVEVIDGWEQPRILAESKSCGSLVGLELRSAATSAIDVMDGLNEVQTKDELVEQAVRSMGPNILTDRPNPQEHPAWAGKLICAFTKKC